MKECPECSMFNAPSEVKCKWCGAHLGDGASGDSDHPASKRRDEDPRAKEAQEKEARKKKIVTWVGYGVLAAALVGYLIYMQVKKGKEEKAPPETPAAEIEGVDGEEAVQGESGPSLKLAEKAVALGDRVTLEAAGLSFAGFAGAKVESPAPGAQPSAFVYRASSKDGSMILSVRLADNPGGSIAPTPDTQARLMADWIVGHGKPIAVPGKGEGKSKTGIPWFMLEADNGDRLERVYWVFAARSRAEISIDYPASGDDVVASEKLADAIVSSIEAVVAGPAPASPNPPAAPAPQENAKAAVPPKAPVKAPADQVAKTPAKPAAPAVKTAPAGATAGE